MKRPSRQRVLSARRASGPPPIALARMRVVKRGDVLVLRSAVEALAAAVAGVFADLPPDAQARALDLAHHLSAVRKQLV